MNIYGDGDRARESGIGSDVDGADLERGRRVYSYWGRHPYHDASQDWLTFSGRHRTIRRAAVEPLGLSSGDRVLEVACGSGRNLCYLEESKDLVEAIGREFGKVETVSYNASTFFIATATIPTASGHST